MVVSPSWSLIESDPSVFSGIISNLGVSNIIVKEVWDIVESLGNSCGSLNPECYGVVFLYKWTRENHEQSSFNCENVYFAKQIAENSCATQAILSVLLNNPDKINLGKNLSEFLEFTAQFDPVLKGTTIAENPFFRSAHNAFGHKDLLSLDDKLYGSNDDEPFHFVAYVPINGVIYLLDGLKDGPIPVANYDSFDSWTCSLVPILMKRITEFSANEIRFNLLSIIQDNEDLLLQALNSCETVNLDIQSQLVELQQLKKQQKLDIIRRKHNYLPFVFEILTILAEKNLLDCYLE